ncbi:DUF1453 domain-containing protein [Dyella marensis]|uniref:DUF1453 domain-containing protein n=1 Tax=Dyella marensis TaxID=500610 RepID=A0A1I2ELY1_9GAMM|nr:MULTISPECIES: DUF1453 domain-containing protein [Dyella]SFE93516.1 hypothetical protein SAMN02799615_01998 [Dyella marensis]
MAPNMIPALMVPLAAFAIYRRVRGNFGPQPIRRKRMIARIAIFAAVTVLFALTGLYNPMLLAGLACGIAGGAVLGTVGLRLTTFGQNAEGADVYIPNPWIGAGLTLLLVGRLAWRFVEVMPQVKDPALAAGHAPPIGSPLTLAVFGLMVGYYLVYFTGLLVHHRRFQRERGLSATAD